MSARGFYYLSVIYNTLMSGKLFWKLPLRGLVENGVLKIQAKSLKNICEEVYIFIIYVFLIIDFI